MSGSSRTTPPTPDGLVASPAPTAELPSGRVVMEELIRRTRHRRVPSPMTVELAYCDHLELETVLRPASTWTADDAARMREFLAASTAHQQVVASSLQLAEYEAGHGDAGRARELLADERLEPCAPRARARRERISALLEAGAA